MALMVQLVASFIDFDKVNGGFASTFWPPVLLLAYPLEFHPGMSLDNMLLSLVNRAFVNWQRPGDLRYRCAEFFSGHGNLTRALLQKFPTCSFDINFSQLHDVLDPKGFRLYMDVITSLLFTGLVWFGTPCSSWVHLCISVSKRYSWNGYFGDLDRQFVLIGNQQMILTSLLFFVAAVLGHVTLLEQPMSSCLPKCGPMCNVLTWLGCVKCTTYMGAFNGPTCKPTQLWTGHSTMARCLARYKPTERGGGTVVHHGCQYTGVKSVLEESAIYTKAFANEVLRAYEAVLSEV